VRFFDRKKNGRKKETPKNVTLKLQNGGGTRKKRGRCMRGRVDISMGMETLIAEALAKIKPTEPLRLAKQAARRKRN
jgi:hypothetical protein